MRAKDVMTDNVLTVGAKVTVLDAARLFVNAGVSAMPVVDDRGAVVGILSEADLIRHTGGVAPTDRSDAEKAARAIDEARSKLVAEVMTRDVATAQEDTTLNEIADLMLKRGIKRVPVMRDGQVMGVVSRVDLLQALLSAGLDAYAPVTPAVRQSDDKLHAEVLDALREAKWPEARRSDVVVLRGAVHLWGMVANEEARARYLKAARSVKGARVVDDHMHVRRPRR